MDQTTHLLTVVAVRSQQEQRGSVLVLQDETGRKLEMTIGLCEAKAIQMALLGTSVERPLTHDLILSIAEHLEVPIERVVIDDVYKQTYFARLILRSPDGVTSIDCRPSDGIALALRAHTPICATDAVMQGEAAEE